MSKKCKIAYRLLLVGGVANIVSGFIHIFLPTVARWKELLRNVPDDFIPYVAVSSKAYFFSQNYELVFICAGGGILTLKYAHRLLLGDRMVAWFSIWTGIIIVYRAATHFFFFGVSTQTIVAFFFIIALAFIYLFPLILLRELRDPWK
ncbi:MAG: hypothetical protein L0338_30545 [Acidobacteria bacterium]|nr:hypothetical protein [Acidobacteriota bacterium]